MSHVSFLSAIYDFLQKMSKSCAAATRASYTTDFMYTENQDTNRTAKLLEQKITVHLM
jgi:site-specific recombinase